MNARALALGALLLIAALSTFAIAFLRPTPPPPSVASSSTNPKYSYIIDVAGWYEITPNESAVASSLDLSIESLKALPSKVGRWSGAPVSLGPEINVWLEHPDVALSSLYHDDRGRQLWLSIFGSRSQKSYFLFEHTPITSYPAAGWTLLQNGVMAVPTESRPIYVQQALLQYENERRIVLYWYLWNDFSRDPEKGVMTIRLHIPVVSSDDDARAAGEDFLRSIFQGIPWHRF